MKFIFAVLLIGLTTLSSYGQQLDGNQLFIRDLQQQAHADSFDILLVGERQIALVIKQASTPLVKGVAVLINDASQFSIGDNSLAPLADKLNSWGWVTMQMPAPQIDFAPIATEENDQDKASQETQTQNNPSLNITAQQPQTATSANFNSVSGAVVISQQSFAQQQQQLQQQLQAIVSRTEQYPGFFLVIAQGTSAAWLTKLYSEEKLESPDALIILSPYWPQRNYNNQLPALVAKTSMPILDFFNQFDNAWSQATAAQRLVSAHKNLKLHYRQRELIGQQLDHQQYLLMAKEIYGWLTYLGW